MKTVDNKEGARLQLARSLRDLADHSTEAELRTDLSRSYYSIFHAAQVLLGKVSHDDIDMALAHVNQKLGETVGRLKQVRLWADYDPHFVDRKFDGDYELFRVTAKGHLEEGRLSFQEILSEIWSRRAGSGGIGGTRP